MAFRADITARDSISENNLEIELNSIINGYLKKKSLNPATLIVQSFAKEKYDITQSGMQWFHGFCFFSLDLWFGSCLSNSTAVQICPVYNFHIAKTSLYVDCSIHLLWMSLEIYSYNVHDTDWEMHISIRQKFMEINSAVLAILGGPISSIHNKYLKIYNCWRRHYQRFMSIKVTLRTQFAQKFKITMFIVSSE